MAVRQRKRENKRLREWWRVGMADRWELRLSEGEQEILGRKDCVLHKCYLCSTYLKKRTTKMNLIINRYKTKKCSINNVSTKTTLYREVRSWIDTHTRGWVPVMSSTVPVGTLSLLPSSFLYSLASLYLSISVVIVGKPGSGWKEERRRRKKKKEEEEDQEAERLYTNKDFPISFHLRQQVHFTPWGFLASLFIHWYQQWYSKGAVDMV